MLVKEFPLLEVNLPFLLELAEDKKDNHKWLRSGLMINRAVAFEKLPAEMRLDNDNTKLEDYTKKIVSPYILTDAERSQAGIKSSHAVLFKTEPNIKAYIHREARAMSLNIPLIFEAGKSWVSFHNDDGSEIIRHVAFDHTPVRLAVGQWHTVHNMSLVTPRITLSCSGFSAEWIKIIGDNHG